MAGADPRSLKPEGWPGAPSARERAGGLALRAANLLTGRRTIGLEYAPADPDASRWGWGAPTNSALNALLATGSDRYRATLDVIAASADHLDAIPRERAAPGEPYWGQDWFTGVDAAALYTFVRTRAPHRYYEVGSGNSTLFARRAARDAGNALHILSVDPAPRAEVDAVCDEIVRTPFESSDPVRLLALEAGDILLVDSSHYALQNSDVVAFFFDVLPHLAAGVLVGVHDIFLPDDYPWWVAGRHYSEQYLVAAWLLGAGADRVVLPTHFACTDPHLRAHTDAVWPVSGVLPYGSCLWFET